MTDQYLLFKTLHVFGAVLLLGNIIVTAWWKLMANRTRDPKIIAFAQRQVVLTDYVFTAVGVLIIISTGEYIAGRLMGNSWDITWIVNGRIFFIASGLIWITILIPVQFKQARLARTFSDDCVIPDQYWRLCNIWNFFGLIATILPFINLYWMVFKPLD
jgi:uncharacterized membrane protein